MQEAQYGEPRYPQHNLKIEIRKSRDENKRSACVIIWNIREFRFRRQMKRTEIIMLNGTQTLGPKTPQQ